jgi:hypothetical protein
MIRNLLFAAAITLAPISASADQIRESIVTQLRSQGFTSITVSRTLLGRSRVVAQSPTLDREIIFNPVTGEIIRDYWKKRLDGQAGATIVNPGQSGGEGEEGTGAEEGDDGNEGDGDGSDGGDDSDGSGGDEGGDGDDSGGDSDGGGDEGDGGSDD